MTTLLLHNPSPYPRGGHVAVPWNGALPAGPLSVVAADGPVLPSQLDRIRVDGVVRDELLFTLPGTIPPGSDDYREECGRLSVRLADGPTDDDRDPDDDPRVEFRVPEKDYAIAGTAEGAEKEFGAARGFRLINQRLRVWVDLADHDGLSWFSGAGSSVVLDGIEALDTFRGLITPEGHDPEKRCMQIDRVALAHPGWAPESAYRVELHNGRYELLACTQGPVRASATIASQPFPYAYRDPVTHSDYQLTCRLYRTISLYGGADHVTEHVWVRGCAPNAADAAGGVDLFFSACYFSYMDMGRTFTVTHHPGVPDWLSIGFNHPPGQGYGFATDVHVRAVAYPHPEYPSADSSVRDHTFSWELGDSDGYHCIHLFKRLPPAELVHQTGHAWYELIYKPLKATVLPQER